MTPSSWSTAPSAVSSQAWRSTTRAIMARLRTSDTAIAQPPLSVIASGATQSRTIRVARAALDCFVASLLAMTLRRRQRLLLGKGAVHLVAQDVGEFLAQGLAARGNRVARTRDVDRHDGLDPSGARREHHDA